MNLCVCAAGRHGIHFATGKTCCTGVEGGGGTKKVKSRTTPQGTQLQTRSVRSSIYIYLYRFV